MSKGLLIAGATGKQGGAVIDALTSDPSTSADYTILAVTRNGSSPSAKALTSKASNVKIVEGDLGDVPALFATAKAVHPNIYGVFSVQVPMGKGQTPETEVVQGKALVDAALEAGVKNFVYTSVERGGDASYDTPTEVPHFSSKYHIEHHLVEKTKGTDMAYTILRPVAFMENFVPGMMGKMFGAMWHSSLGDSKKLQLISVADIGYFAAQAFLKPEKYANRQIGLAGDDLTWEEVEKVFQDKTGSAAPRTYDFMGAGLMWGVKEMGIMFNFFKTTGYGVRVSELKKEHPGILSLGEWIEKKSAYTK